MKINLIFITILSFIFLTISCSDTKKDKNKTSFYQWGTKFNDLGKDATIDEDGNIYVVSNESESTEKGKLVLTKFNSKGNFLWSKKYTKNNNFFPNKIIVNEIGIYIIAYNMILQQEDYYTANLIKLDKNGEEIWIKDISISDDGTFVELKDFLIKDEQLYIIGSSFESMASDNKNIFILVLDSDGKTISMDFIGTNKSDEAIAMTFDEDKANLYILGITQGTFNETPNLGMGDVLIMKIDTNNNNELIWGRTFGTSKTDFATKLAYNGNLFVLGHTSGMLENGQKRGENDIFVSKVNEGGFIEWSKQFGTDKEDFSTDLILKDDNIYILGNTLGEFEKSNGEKDIFLLKLNKDGFKKDIKQFGTDKKDSSFRLLEKDNSFYLLGTTKGQFIKTFGEIDLFKVKTNF